MANWNTLKAAINNIIKTNGNQAITGQVMQNALNNIISNLGENATFAGVATPTTNPGAPDGPVFYFAFEAGTYNNFGGAVINEVDNVKIILRKNNIWSIIDTGLPNNTKITVQVQNISDKLLNQVNDLSNGVLSQVKNIIKRTQTSIETYLNNTITRIEETVNTIYSQINTKIQNLQNKVENQKNEVENAANEAIEDINSEKDKVISSFNSQRVTPEMLSKDTLDLINSSGGGTITNLADGEDLYSTNNTPSVLKFRDKDYNAQNYSGYGRVYLRKNIQNYKNILTQNMISFANTMYIIQYDYDLNNQTINIPENCILNFQGGSFANGILNFNNALITGKTIHIFKNTLNIAYTENYEWIFKGLQSNIVCDPDEEFTVSYSGSYRLMQKNNPLTAITNGTKVTPKDVLGLLRKTRENKIANSVVEAIWFEQNNADSLQIAIDFATASGINKVELCTETIIDKPVILREYLNLFSSTSRPNIIGQNTSCIFFASSQYYISIHNVGIYANNNSNIQYGIILLESHFNVINRLIITGYIKKGAVVYGACIYTRMVDSVLSMAYAPQEENEKYPFCISGEQETYNIAYYGLQLGIFNNCSFIGAKAAKLSGGIVKFYDCDFEGRLTENGVIEAQNGAVASALSLSIINSYCEFSATNDSPINACFVFQGKSGLNLTIKGCQLYSTQGNRVKSYVFLQNSYANSIAIKNNNVNRFDGIISNLYYSSNAILDIKNNILSTSFKGAMPSLNRYGDTRTITALHEFINNSPNISLYNFYTSYKFKNGFAETTTITAIRSKHRILNTGLANYIDLQGNTVEYFLNSSELRGSVYYLTNGNIIISEFTKTIGGKVYISKSGYYTDFIPTTVISSEANLLVLPIVKSGKIVNVWCNKPLVTTNQISLTVNGSGTGAILEAVIENNYVTNINIVNAGLGYDDMYFNESDNIFPMFEKASNGYKLSAAFIDENCTTNSKAITLNLLGQEDAECYITYSRNILSYLRTNTTLKLGNTDLAIIVLVNSNPTVVALSKNLKRYGVFSAKPNNLQSEDIGFTYFDTSNNKPIFWNGSMWVDATGNSI